MTQNPSTGFMAPIQDCKSHIHILLMMAYLNRLWEMILTNRINLWLTAYLILIITYLFVHFKHELITYLILTIISSYGL